VPLDRQVELRVGGVQIGSSALAVGDAPDRHLPEHACQQRWRPARRCHAGGLGVGDLRQALRSDRTKVEAVLE
jgi:hypothetical protein